MFGIDGKNVEEEYFWSITLDDKTKEYVWNPSDDDGEDDDDDDPSVGPSHRLIIKSVLLHPEAEKDQITVIQLDGKGFKGEKVSSPICAMKGGRDLQGSLELLVPNLATLKLKSGSGPITLIGSHYIDYYANRDYLDMDEAEEEEGEEEEDAASSADEEMDEQEAVVAAKKNEKGSPKEGSAKKKGKKAQAEKSPSAEAGKKGEKAQEADKKRKASSEAAADEEDDSKKTGSGKKAKKEGKRKRSSAGGQE